MAAVAVTAVTAAERAAEAATVAAADEEAWAAWAVRAVAAVVWVAVVARAETEVRAEAEAVGERAEAGPSRSTATSLPESALHCLPHRTARRRSSIAPCLLCCPTRRSRTAGTR